MRVQRIPGDAVSIRRRLKGVFVVPVLRDGIPRDVLCGDLAVMADELFMNLAFQCRSRFIVTPYGTAKLIVRQLQQASGHAIVKNEIKLDSMNIERSPTSDLVNTFAIRYDKDHSVEGLASDAYKKALAVSDATSNVGG